MAPKFGNPYQRLNRLQNITGIKQDEYVGTVSGYILERKLKRIFRERGFAGQEIVTIDMKIERLAKPRLQDLLKSLEREGVAVAIKALGVENHVCLCAHQEKNHVCEYLKDPCSCCTYCQRNCKRMFKR